MKNYKKPPLGIMPQWLWREQSLQEIKECIKRYICANYPISEDLINEYNEMVNCDKDNEKIFHLSCSDLNELIKELEKIRAEAKEHLENAMKKYSAVDWWLMTAEDFYWFNKGFLQITDFVLKSLQKECHGI